MGVVLSMLTLQPGGMGGSETYARELLRELATSPLAVSTLVSPLAAGVSGGVPEVVVSEYKVARTDRQRAAALVHARLMDRRLRRYARDAAVIHYPFTVPVPRTSPGQRSIVTLHDVQHHDLPHLFSRAERTYRRLAYNRAARQADAVITVSKFCKARIVHTLAIDPRQVHVAPLGVRMEEFVTPSAAREEFLLYPAKGWAHKNHSTLLTAFTLLRRSRPRMRLVLTGVQPAELPSVPAGVEICGSVPRPELIRLYGTASALVFPSLYEGFGLPVIEAMSAGCPVAAARSGALPEVVGDAGVLFAAEDPVDIVRAVEEALDRSSELRASGFERAQAFTWRRCAEEHLKLYDALGA